MTATVVCPGCDLSHPAQGLDSPSNLLASGECAADYAATISCFYGDPDLVPLRQYVVDAYACQHPRTTTRKGVQTTALCLMTLDLILERGQDVASGSLLHQEMMRGDPGVFVALASPDLRTALTYRHLSPTDVQHAPGERAREWAQSVWAAWAAHHGQVRQWNKLLVPHRL